MNWRSLASALVLVALASGTTSIAVAPPPQAVVSVMFDFGTGRILWEDVLMSFGQSAWNATAIAADWLGLALNVTWYGTDVFVQDIGAARPSYPDYWHFLRWNVSAWELSDVGASSASITGDAVFGWFLTRDDPSWDFNSPWPGPRPEATPDPAGRYPVQMFRYDELGSGVAVGAGPADPIVAWSFNTTAFEITATPAIAHGVVYLNTWAGFFAVSESSGALLWKNSRVAGASSPALYGGRIYVGGNDGRLHVLSELDGQELWNLTLQPNPQFSGITASPRIAYGHVYIGTFNETGGDGTFYAIDLFGHNVTWSRPVSSVHFSTAAVVNHTIYVGLIGRFRPADLTYGPPYGLLALDVDTGAERWFVPTNGSVASSPAVHGDTVYITTKAAELLAVGTDGRVRWNATLRTPSIASPAVTDGLVIAASGVLGTSGDLAGFTHSGTERWGADWPASPISASPTVAGSYVYLATNEAAGRVIARNATDIHGGWEQTLEPHEYLLSSPVVHDGILFIASDNGILYALRDTIRFGPGGDVFLFPTLVILLSVVAVVVAVAGAAYVVRRRRRGP